MNLCRIGMICLWLGSAVAARSSALDNWHWRNPLPTGNGLWGVTYGNGLFVAVGESGTILTSPDGASPCDLGTLTLQTFPG